MVRNRWQLWLGVVLISIGVLIALGKLLNIDFGQLCWPIGFIAIGLWLVLRPRFTPAELSLVFVGDVKPEDRLTDREMLVFVGDVDLDLATLELAPGETRLRILGLVNEIDVKLAPEVGFRYQAYGLMCETKIMGQKQQSFLVPFDFQTPNYDSAERKVRLETVNLVAEVAIDE